MGEVGDWERFEEEEDHEDGPYFQEGDRENDVSARKGRRDFQGGLVFSFLFSFFSFLFSFSFLFALLAKKLNIFIIKASTLSES